MGNRKINKDITQIKHRNIKLVVAYNGKNYYGMQLLPDLPTITGKLKEAAFLIFSEKPKFIIAGRTDAKVNALGQVVNFYIDTRMSKIELKNAFNANLPEDIRVVDVEFVGYDFSARFKAKSREYRYYILYNVDTKDQLFLPEFYYILDENLDIDLMKKASLFLIGQHDFSTFAKGRYKNPVRQIFSIDIKEKKYFSHLYNKEYNLCELVIKGNSFLRQMVRLIVSSLIEVAKKNIPPEEIKVLLDLKNNYYNFPPAPAQALFLYKVEY